MGSANVILAGERWGQLPNLPFRVLAHMAMHALDLDRAGSDGQPAQLPRRYWGGWPALAHAVGRSMPDLPDDDDTSAEAQAARRARRASHESIRAAVATLVKAGAIRRVRHGRSGCRAEYELNLGLWITPALVAGQGQGEPAPQGQDEPAPQGQGEPVFRGRVSLPPRSTEEDRGLQPGGHHLSLLSHLEPVHNSTKGSSSAG